MRTLTKLGIFASALMLSTAIPTYAGASTLEYNGLTFSTDRYDTDVFEALDSYAGRDNVLHFGIGENGYTQNRPSNYASSFYNYQGMTALTNLPNGDAYVQGGLYVPANWATSTGGTLGGTGNTGDFQATALWTVLGNTTDGAAGYPIVSFTNINGVGVVQAWDDFAGTWTDVEAPINYGGWNDVRVEYRNGTAVYIFNGVEVATIDESTVDSAGNTLYRLILNSYNNGTSAYDVYWSDLGFGELRYGGELSSTDFDVDTTGANDSPDGSIYGGDVKVSDGSLHFGSGVTIGGDLNLDGSSTSGGLGTPTEVAGDTNVDGSSTLGGNINNGGDLNNGGTLSPGNSPGVINVAGNYNAAPGAVYLAQVDLNKVAPVAGVDFDQVNVAGNVTGTTIIRLYKPSAGVPTDLIGGSDPVGNVAGLNIVTVGGANPAGSFVLDRRYVQYGHDIGIANTATGVIVTSTVAPETSVLSAIPNAELTAGQNIVGTYATRRGLANTSGAWIRTIGGSASNGDVDTDTLGVLIGSDVGASEMADNLHFGVAIGYASANSEVNTGKANSASTILGAYFTYDNADYYADLYSQVRFINISANAPLTKLDSNGLGVDVAGEVGKRFKLSESLMVTPHVQVLYQRLSLDNYKDANFDASYSNLDSLRVRGGATLDWKAGENTTLSLGTGISLALMDDANTTVSGYKVNAKSDDARAYVNAGIDTRLTNSTKMFASVETTSGSDQTGVLGRVGLRFDF